MVITDVGLPLPEKLNNCNGHTTTGVNFYLDSTDSEDAASVTSTSSFSRLRLNSNPALEGQYIRLSDKINHRNGEPFFSLEFFPPRTKRGAGNLLARLERLRAGSPLFCDITWHPAGNPSGDSETSSLAIASASLNYCGLDTVLHMTCTSQSVAEIAQNLEKAKDAGIRTILALRGDRQDDSKPLGFNFAIDLVKYIRQEYGDYFDIGVAGYPTGHPEAVSYEDDLYHLKAKVDAGADFVITQLFFSADVFIKFVNDCHRIGIRVPIIPGVMPIQSYDSLRHIIKLSKMEIPNEIVEKITSLKDNDEAIRNYGIQQAIDMIKALLMSGVAPGIHFYTLNREVAVISIARQVGLWIQDPHRSLPWKVVPNHKRCHEEIRPIFWSTRPNAYIHRTQHWDEFPNGRWGSAESPAFGDLKDYYLFYLKSKSPKEELLKMWGKEIHSEKEVWNVFYNYVSGEPNSDGIKVTSIPWNDGELSPETAKITDKLASLNRRGVLTINSQPNVNGCSSTDPVHGWGHPGGYVYQKAYLEFFTSEENIKILKNILPNYPQVNYHMINKNGKFNYSDSHGHCPIAVTWGSFPGREIIQPTVVDPESFLVWKDEAFALWIEQWANLYPTESISRSLITSIANDYYLVNLVDNDYPKETCLFEIVEKMLQTKNQNSEF